MLNPLGMPTTVQEGHDGAASPHDDAIYRRLCRWGAIPQLWSCPAVTPEPFAVTVTPRHAEILTGICKGQSNLEIASRLIISEDTVKTHIKTIYAKLGARNRAHAAALVTSGQVTVTIRDTRWGPR